MQTERRWLEGRNLELLGIDMADIALKTPRLEGSDLEWCKSERPKSECDSDEADQENKWCKNRRGNLRNVGDASNTQSAGWTAALASGL